MKWIFTVIVFCLFINGASSQTASGVPYGSAYCAGASCPVASSIKTHITAAYFDTINEVVYIGGTFSKIGSIPRAGLAAIDAVTGSVLSFSPTVNNGTVLAIAKSGDTLFIGGTFTQINGQARNRIAALNISTSALTTTFTVGTTNATDSVMSLLKFGNYLFIGGRFTSILGNAHTNIARASVGGSNTSWNPSAVFQGPIRKLNYCGTKILALYYNNTLSSDRIDKIDTSSAGTRTVIASADPAELINDFALRGNVCFLIGPFFAINGISRTTTAAVDVNTLALTTWNPQPPYSAYDARSKFSIEYYRDSLYIGVFDASSVQPTYNRMYVAQYNSGAMRVLKIYNSNILGVSGYFNDNILIGNARIFEIEKFQHHSNYPMGCDSCVFHSWCLKPPSQVGPFTVFPLQVCPGDSNKTYSVLPLAYFSAYNWSSTNPLISAFGNTNSASVDFAYSFSGSGTIRVLGYTSCGLSTTIYRTTTVSALPQPNSNAGNDDTLNCILSQLMLHGTSVTAGATFFWNGPTGFSNSDSILADTTGNYVLTVHGPNGCWKYDTTVVRIDTVPPPIVPFTSVGTLTCRDTIVTLDAASLYPGDSLSWTGPGLLSPADPALATQSSNYLLHILSRGNGCSNYDTIYVGSNYVIPNASIIAPDTVLTCSLTNVTLDASSANPDVTYQWTDSSGTFYANPFSDSVPGVFQLHATDTSNGCVNVSNVILISTWYTPPGIAPLQDSVFLNCSYSSLLVNADSLTSGATLNWTGPNSFSSSDPATLSQQGMYYVNAMHPQNGCVSVDSVYVGYQQVLDVQAGNDTTICPGSSALVNADPIGGTSPFNYSWTNGAGNNASANVIPIDTTEYIVSVNDAAGCAGTDTIIVNVPDPIGDYVLAFQPCDPLTPTGQLQVFAYHGVPPFQYSIDNGMSWNSNGVFTNLGYGNYSILIRDTLGCMQSLSASIDTNSLIPAPDFLVSTSSMLGDTLVFVDISNPRPDSVQWDFPPTVLWVNTDMFAPEIINTDTGAFPVSMHAFFGSCETVLTRTINVHPFDSAFANAWNNNGIDTVMLYPDPNNGIFTADVELFSKQDFVIIVYDANGTEHTRIPVYDTDHWNGQVSVANAVTGNYFLRVVAEYDSDELSFIISQ
ncbi:MAG TPA: hypothetical protein VL651_00635 [Bacteroidia bacterium]|nr:hypothetical protein [Bacteroidia bacterium]